MVYAHRSSVSVSRHESGQPAHGVEWFNRLDGGGVLGKSAAMMPMAENTVSKVLKGRPARRPAPRIGAALGAFNKAHRKTHGGGCAEIAARWSDIAGERLAKLSTPVKLTAPGNAGVLYVHAQGAAALLIEADAERILENAALCVGRPVARRIVVRQAAPAQDAGNANAAPGRCPPRIARRLDASLEPIADPGLKAALKALGRSVHGASHKDRAGR